MRACPNGDKASNIVCDELLLFDIFETVQVFFQGFDVMLISQREHMVGRDSFRRNEERQFLAVVVGFF